MIMVYITCKDEKQAIHISRKMLEGKLAACANIFPIKTMYIWNGKIESSSEFAMLAKTTDKNYDKIKKLVLKLHSYKIPCIVKINAEANESYEKWVDEGLGC